MPSPKFSAFWQRYRRDLDFQASASLRLSLIVNLCYALFKGWMGIRYHSVWFGALAAYYLIVSLSRSHLARSMGRSLSPRRSWTHYCQTGWLLWLVSLVLSVLGAMMLFHQDRIAYPGYLIYAAALYTFYAVISAIRNLVRYRRAKPVQIAAKAISLCTALVTLFSMQTAMLSQFGSDEGFYTLMSALTGSAVFFLIHISSIYMILHGRKRKKSAQD